MNTPPLTPDRSEFGRPSVRSSSSSHSAATVCFSDQASSIISAATRTSTTRFVDLPMPDRDRRRASSVLTLTAIQTRIRSGSTSKHKSAIVYSSSPASPSPAHSEQDAGRLLFPYTPSLLSPEESPAPSPDGCRSSRSTSLPASRPPRLARTPSLTRKSTASTSETIAIDAGLSPPRLRESKVFNFARTKSQRSSRRNSSILSGKDRLPLVDPPFDEHALPTHQELRAAASLQVMSEQGQRVRFGDLWEGSRTVVIFIRHFWCPACQDYLRSIDEDADVAALERLGLKLVVVGLGSPALITSYKRINKTRVPLYTDPTLAVHRTLGMTLKSTDGGSEAERGGYINHTLVGGICRSVGQALVGKMPIMHKGGDIGQLGGEFVLGPGLTCGFAHRMTNTRNHAPVLSVVCAAGLDPNAVRRLSQASTLSEIDDEEQWMERRRLSLARIHEKRQSRRAGDCGAGKGFCDWPERSLHFVHEDKEERLDSIEEFQLWAHADF